MAAMRGGEKMIAMLRGIVQKSSRAKKIDVGFFSEKTYAKDGKSVPMVAAVQEFGSAKTPPRPFFRGMIKDKSKEWPGAIASLLRANAYDARKTLEQTGEAVAGQLRRAIVDFDSVPLSPKTVARKGNSKQLVDTGTMLDSVGSKVE